MHSPRQRLSDSSYFARILNRSDQEREEGEKEPTLAHRAIAELAAQGFIKVIITTNFDRLVETALREEGVEPTVL